MPITTTRIAVFTDNRQLSDLLEAGLPAGSELCVCDNPLRELPGEAHEVRPDVLVVDFSRTSPGGHVEDRVLADLQQLLPDLSLVLLTGDDCPEPLARRATLTRMVHVCDRRPWQRLRRAVNRACESRHATSADATATIANPGPVLDGITQRFQTNSPSLQWMLQELDVAARHDVTLLLIGETGVGKTYLARLIHDVSPRREKPFLPVSCGALPGDLLESELFGHTRGSFTGAHADKDGKFVAAGRGTILLDEIDVLGPEQQVKLLRVIETGEFEPLGSNVTLTRQARLVVASNLDLQPLVRQGRFRADLFYRLNMMKFELPPLRDRGEDVSLLTHTLAARLAAEHGVTVSRIDDGFLADLQRYPWPGNVRELENVLRRAVIFCRDGILRAEHLPRSILSCEPGPANDPSVRLELVGASSPRSPRSLGGQIETTEREIIRQALAGNNHSRTRTARQLGISRVTLYNKMRKYDLA